MKTANEIVNYLQRHFQQEQGETPPVPLSPKIDDLTADMGEFIKERLEEDTPHKVIWTDFTQSPVENSASLAGILEALFEAQPGVRERVEGFMQSITAIEAAESERETVQKETAEESLKARAGALVPDEGEASAKLADGPQEKTPPAYLYDNERAGYETVEDPPVSNPFLVGDNAQIIYLPEEEMQFPFMFMHLGRLSSTSEDLSLDEKEKIQGYLDEIRGQLSGDREFNDSEMAQAFENIWEIAPSYANVLIESLQTHIEELPLKTRDFIIQLHTPLH